MTSLFTNISRSIVRAGAAQDRVSQLNASHDIACALMDEGRYVGPIDFEGSLKDFIPEVPYFEYRDPNEPHLISSTGALERLNIAMKCDSRFAPRAEGLSLVVRATASGGVVHENPTNRHRMPFEEALDLLVDAGFDLVTHPATGHRFILCSSEVPAWNMTTGVMLDYKRRHPVGLKMELEDQIDSKILKGIMPPSSREGVIVLGVDDLQSHYAERAPIQVYSFETFKPGQYSGNCHTNLYQIAKNDPEFRAAWVRFFDSYPIEDAELRVSRVAATELLEKLGATLGSSMYDTLIPGEPMLTTYRISTYADRWRVEDGDTFHLRWIPKEELGPDRAYNGLSGYSTCFVLDAIHIMHDVLKNLPPL